MAGTAFVALTQHLRCQIFDHEDALGGVDFWDGACVGDNPTAWCLDAWCYVDPCTCYQHAIHHWVESCWCDPVVRTSSG